MNQAVIEGNTHFYLTVEGEDGSIFDFALPGLLDIVGYKVGDEINFTRTWRPPVPARPTRSWARAARLRRPRTPRALPVMVRPRLARLRPAMRTPPANPRTTWCSKTGPPRRLPTLLSGEDTEKVA